MTSIWLSPPIRAPLAADAAQSLPIAAQSADDKAKPVAPLYFSPIVRIDPKTESAVWEVRDPETGEVIRQWPPDHTANAYRAQVPAGPGPQFAQGALAEEIAPQSMPVADGQKKA